MAQRSRTPVFVFQSTVKGHDENDGLFTEEHISVIPPCRHGEVSGDAVPIGGGAQGAAFEGDQVPETRLVWFRAEHRGRLDGRGGLFRIHGTELVPPILFPDIALTFIT